jgi:Holliday junction resolvase RusA-like endonuclease
MPIPKYTHTAKKKRMHCCPHDKKPDADNLEKFLNDALKGLIWSDDAKISWLLRSKTHINALKGEIILYVREMGEGRIDYNFLLEDIQKHIKVEEEVI